LISATDQQPCIKDLHKVADSSEGALTQVKGCWLKWRGALTYKAPSLDWSLLLVSLLLMYCIVLYVRLFHCKQTATAAIDAR